MIITIKELKKLNACTPGLIGFCKAFPEGKVSIEELKEAVEINVLRWEEADWLGWLARYPGLSMDERLWLIGVSNYPGLYAGTTARDASALTVEERIYLAGKTGDMPRWLQSIILYTAELTETDKEQLRKMCNEKP